MMPLSRAQGRQIIIGLGVLAAWQLLGNTQLASVLPAPLAILRQAWADRDVYPAHLGATALAAAVGFCIGNTVAICAALAFCRFPLTESLLRGVNITLFALPPLVVAPVLVLVLSGDLPQIMLAALVVYYPTMAAMLTGLHDIDPRLPDIIAVYGGGANAMLRHIRLRAALPALLAGLKVAATAAVLGAILAEFGSGARWGLGSFLLGTIASGNAPRLWGIAIAATLLALAFYAVFALASQRVIGATRAVTMAATRAPDAIAARGSQRLAVRLGLALGALALPFLLWWGILAATGLSPIIAPGPLHTLSYLLQPDTLATLRDALVQTLPLTLAGLVLGLLAAFLLAALGVLAPRAAQILLVPALLVQTTPLVALAPIVLLLLGRDVAATLAMAVAVVFFPAFVMLAQGFALVPRVAQDLVASYGGSRLAQFRLVAVPHAMPYLFAAAKLVAPRALLGVMIAEWLLSGRGLGNLLNNSRGTLDYDMVWAGALVSIVIAVIAYQAVGWAETLVRRRGG